MSTSTSSVLTAQNIEDWLMLVLPIITVASGFDWSMLVPGLGGLVAGVFLASLVKSISGLGMSANSYEDWLQFFITLAGGIGAGIQGDPRLMIYGIALGWVAKALPSLAQGLNIEDVLLLVSAILGAAGVYWGYAWLTDLALLLGTIGKAVPSIVNPTAAATPSPMLKRAPPTPTAKA